MNTLETIKARKSTRGFTPIQVSKEAIETILAAGSAAPVGMAQFGSLQLTVVQDRALLDKISAAAVKGTPREGQDIFYGAQAVILISQAEQPVPELKYANAGTITENFLLAATEIGIDSVYIFGVVGAYANDPSWTAEAKIPAGHAVVSSVALGYGTEEAKAAQKPPREIQTVWV